MESLENLNVAIQQVEDARGVPLSASFVLHRGEFLELLDLIKDGLPKDLEYAQQIIAQRDQIIEEGHQNAEALIVSAREEVAQMIEQTAIVKAAREESKRILAQGREAAEDGRLGQRRPGSRRHRRPGDEDRRGPLADRRPARRRAGSRFRWCRR